MRTSHFNDLTEAEQERLSCLLEECAEVVKAVGKIQRHGYKSKNPKNPGETNRQQLQREMGDLLYIMLMMAELNDVKVGAIYEHCHNKKGTIGPYLHHNNFS